MTYNDNSSGSIWRKWDLQVQPIKNEWFADLDRNSDRIRQATGEFVNKGYENGIEVIGITDHNSGVAIDYAINENKVNIIPGVELDTPEGWHLLVLFNQDYKNTIEVATWKEAVDNFLVGTCGVQRPFFNRQNVGKKITCTTIELLKKVTEENIGVPIFAHCCSNDGFFQNSDAAGRKNIIDLFINGIAKFAFEIKDNLEQKNLIKTKLSGWYDGRDIDIPIISSSDAHNASNVGSTFSWIKADPSYEGLKQILYEPDERIRLIPETPDEKKIYDIIEKVKFQDTNFTTKEIPISQNLTTIIGGKSTGKSILLKNIAKCVDANEYNKRNKSIYLTERNPIKGFEVFWKDGQKSQLDGQDSNPNKRIIYIPQSYLNRVVDQEQETTDIDEIIRDVLLQEEEFSDWYKNLGLREKYISNSIKDSIRELFDNLDEYRSVSAELKKRGDKDGLQQQINKIKQDISEQQKIIRLSEEELRTYDEKTRIIKDNQAKIERIDKDINTLQNASSLKISFPDSGQYILVDTVIAVEELIEKKSTEYGQDWKSSLDLIVESLSVEKKTLADNTRKTENEVSEISKKVEDQKFLKSKFSELETEEKKAQEISLWEAERKRLQEKIIRNITNLAQLNADFYSIYLEAKDHVSLSGLDDELDFNIDTVFSQNFYLENFVNKYFDGRSLKSESFDYFTKYIFDSKPKHQEFIQGVIGKILKNEIPLNKSSTSEEVINALCQNWFVHDYKVVFQGDQLVDMSPGKKSFVLLRLLIDLDNSECPILIDQPEDDLDNRSIYDDVVDFLKRRKRFRQIIIVTHNPNLVLGADAELIIVANQEGDDTKNEKFKFEYVSGAIEHSFPENNDIEETLLKRGIQEHVCGILEGGEDAFNKRRNKYRFSR